MTSRKFQSGSISTDYLYSLAGFAVGGVLVMLYRYSILPYLDGDTKRGMYFVYAMLGGLTSWVIQEVRLRKRTQFVTSEFSTLQAQLTATQQQSRSLAAARAEDQIAIELLSTKLAATAHQSAAAVPTEGGVTVRLPHTTKALEGVFEVMWRNWSNVDPARLPKQVNIARELDAALGKGSKGDPAKEPSRDGKVIAALIRPDELGAPSDTDPGPA